MREHALGRYRVNVASTIVARCRHEQPPRPHELVEAGVRQGRTIVRPEHVSNAEVDDSGLASRSCDSENKRDRVTNGRTEKLAGRS